MLLAELVPNVEKHHLPMLRQYNGGLSVCMGSPRKYAYAWRGRPRTLELCREFNKLKKASDESFTKFKSRTSALRDDLIMHSS
jgi:hypothetical protein